MRCPTALVLVLLVASGIVGCSNPMSDPFEAGQMVVVADDGPTSFKKYSDPIVRLSPGTRCEVDTDRGEKDSTQPPSDRLVLVVVKTGVYAGQSGSLKRRELRPAP